jgi:outer membrane protein assembly factor BamB
MVRSRRAHLTLALIAGGAVFWSAGPAAASTNDPWSTFHHDPAHTGVSPDTVIGATHAIALSVKWSRAVGGGAAIASPVTAYNATLAKTVVYAVSFSGMVHAFDAATGTTVWANQQSVGAGVVASPAVDGNSLYFGDDGGSLIALDAATGAPQCTFTLPIFAPETVPGRIQDAVVITHDSTGPIVYFGDTGQSESVNHGHEWAIDGYGDSNGSCKLKWSYDISKAGSKRKGSWSPPALATDSTGRPLVLFGSNQPDDAVYALDGRTGGLVWRFQTLVTFPDADVGAGPTVSAPGINRISDGMVYIDGKDRIEYAIDLLHGTQQWSFDMKADSGHSTNSVSCAALVGNLVVVAYSDFVYGFNATTGVKVWRSNALAGNVLGSVSVSGAAGDQVALIGDLKGKVSAVRISDGALLVKLALSSAGFDASPAVSAGMAFIAGLDGTLYALG